MTTTRVLRNLGRTDIQVSPIGLGVMQFSGAEGIFRFVFNDLQQDEMNAIIAGAFQGGINWFDTAELYGRGRSERALAQGLKSAGVKDEDVIVCTKWWPMLRTASNIPSTIDTRLQCLNCYSIDHYIVHQPWGFSSVEAEMHAMADLVEAGKIRTIGVSNFSAQQMRRAQTALAERGMVVASNQVQYSLLDRAIEKNGVLDTARDLGISIVAWGPLGSGLLTGKFHREATVLERTPIGRRMRMQRQLDRTRPLVEQLNQIADGHGATPAQVALNWLVKYSGDSVLAIPGASKVHQAEEAAGAMGFELSSEELAKLDEVSRAI